MIFKKVPTVGQINEYQIKPNQIKYIHIINSLIHRHIYIYIHIHQLNVK